MYRYMSSIVQTRHHSTQEKYIKELERKGEHNIYQGFKKKHTHIQGFDG